uniref:Transposase n=1 Tax=Panagrellus redivivus TaxID=6233 RepID=A0A7E4V303_PANRE
MQPLGGGTSERGIGKMVTPYFDRSRWQPLKILSIPDNMIRRRTMERLASNSTLLKAPAPKELKIALYLLTTTKPLS